MRRKGILRGREREKREGEAGGGGESESGALTKALGQEEAKRVEI